MRRDPVVLSAFAAAAAARLAFALLIPAADFPYRRYLGPAVEFAHGRWFSALSADQLPGAPMIFALLLPFTGENFAALALVQHALGLATWWLTVRLSWRAGGPGAARWTACLLTAQLILPYQERFLFSEAAAYFFLALALNAAYELREEPKARPWRWAAGGAVAALAALTRGEFLALGPVLGAALALPKKGRSLTGLGAYSAAWALMLGGWLAHNRLAGCPGFNALGSSTLVDTAFPLLRHDLPTHELAKRLLREEAAVCGDDRGCTPRLQAVDRLWTLRDPQRGPAGLIRARAEVGAAAWEAIRSQPGRYAALVREKLVFGLLPIAWVDEYLLDPASPPNASSPRVWALLRRGPQYLGWAPFILSFLAPLVLLLSPRPGFAWKAGVLASVAAVTVAVAAPSDMSARLQASWYLPLSVLGGLAAQSLSEALTPALKRGKLRS